MAIEKDVHSVYIDNELPPAYIEKYEAQVQADAASAKALNDMQSLHNALRQDAQELTVDDAFLEASFARLQTKLQYHRHIVTAHAVAPQETKPKIYQFARWGVSFAAAAAVFALIITPVYLRAGNNTKENAVSAIYDAFIRT